MDYIHSNNGILRGTQTPEENVDAPTGTLYYRNTGLLGSSGSVDITVYGIDLS